MTEGEVSRANDLILARYELVGMMRGVWNRRGSFDAVRSMTAEEQKQWDRSVVAQISVIDKRWYAPNYDDDDTIMSILLPRDLLTNYAFPLMLAKIENELAQLGVEFQPIPALPDTATASDTPNTAIQSDTGQEEVAYDDKV